MLNIRSINNLVHSKINGIRQLDRVKLYIPRIGSVINRFLKSALVKQIIYVMTLFKEQCVLLTQTLIS